MNAQPIPGQDVSDAPPWPTADIHCSVCQTLIPDNALMTGWSDSADAVIVCSESCANRWHAAHPRP